MKPAIYESAEKIKCPVCENEFIPAYYHLEKNNFEVGNNHLNLRITKFKNKNGNFKPKRLIRKSWITSCPECFYVLRFAAEVSKKRLMNGESSLFHIREFKENWKWFKYEVESIDKPYEEILSYNEKYFSKVKRKISKALDSLELFKWGTLYKNWANDFTIDSFKFLIRFCSNFDNYCEELNEWTRTQSLEYKMDALDLSDDLKEIMMKVEGLRLDTLNDYYELKNKDEKILRKAFLKLMFELVYTRLKPLDLGDINLLEFNDDYDKEIFLLRIEHYLEDYIESNLGLKDELQNFIRALFRKLGLPPLKIESRYKTKEFISKLFKK